MIRETESFTRERQAGCLALCLRGITKLISFEPDRGREKLPAQPERSAVGIKRFVTSGLSSQDFVSVQRAWVLFITSALSGTLGLGTVLLNVISRRHTFASPNTLAPLAVFVICCVSIALLRRGSYRTAAHTIVLLISVVVWLLNLHEAQAGKVGTSAPYLVAGAVPPALLLGGVWPAIYGALYLAVIWILAAVLARAGGEWVPFLVDYTAACTFAIALSSAISAIYSRALAMTQDLLTRVEEFTQKVMLSERLLREVTSTVPGVFSQISVRPDGSRKTSYVSSQSESMFDISADPNTCDDEFVDRVLPECRTRLLESMREAAGTFSPWRYECRLRRRSGEIVWFQADAVPVRRDGDEAVYNGVLIDITERKRMEEAQRELEAQKQQFYRDTLLSVTDGKLDICGEDEVRPYVDSAEISVEVDDAEATAEARHQVAALCQAKGLEPDDADWFVVGAGEAITNAVKHAGHGWVYAGERDQAVWTAVVDHGPGISSLLLPQAVLRRGFSTKASMGLGYTVMLDAADRILLCTGSSGTSVVLTKRLVPEPSGPAIGPMRDAW